ncbi:MAG: GNAT family N-acetyltransferase [Anaerolineae bacterium]|nr:GNAT family N-acetyltransferase [Anaerolineae bacterium]
MSKEKKYINFQPLVSVQGSSLRHFAGDEDYEIIRDIFIAAKKQNGIFWDWGNDIEEFKEYYKYCHNFDPQEQFAIAEINGSPIGTLEYFWQDSDDPYQRDFYCNFFWHPDVTNTPFPEIMLSYIEKKCHEMALKMKTDRPLYLNARCMASAKERLALLARNDYEPLQFSYSMVRDLSLPIETHQLPEGIEIRTVQPEHYKSIWMADHLAFEDHWGEVDNEEDFQSWLHHPQFQPSLWKVAWQGDKICGMVLNYIDKDENTNSKRQRGYTEGISVQKPWRKQGIAKALISISLHMLRDMGMDEAKLGVIAQNKDGALNLYLSLGYIEQKETTGILFQKPLHP